MDNHKHAIYDSLENAEKNGWLTIGDARRQLAGTPYIVKDTSGSNSEGYEFTIGRLYDEKLDGKLTLENCRGKWLIGSDTISFNHFDRRSNTQGYKFGEMFSEKLVRQLINKGE